MEKIIIASKNPVKIKATLNAFQTMFSEKEFEIETISVSSGVSDQPKTNLESFQGALNRANNASKENAEADYWVGIEGGIEAKGSEMESFAWVVVKSKEGCIGKGKSATFFLPPKIAQLIKEGKELGEADDIVFGKTNSKQENGAVGILTDNATDRTKYYTEAIIFALIPFKKSNLYS